MSYRHRNVKRGDIRPNDVLHSGRNADSSTIDPSGLAGRRDDHTAAAAVLEGPPESGPPRPTFAGPEVGGVDDEGPAALEAGAERPALAAARAQHVEVDAHAHVSRKRAA